MPTSATTWVPYLPRSERRGPSTGRTGFTLLEVLIALSIIAMAAAVVLPGLAQRLDSAFSDADLEQVLASARLLPARAATLGIDLRLDAGALARPLPDGRPPLDLPPGWTVQADHVGTLWSSGTCDAASVLLQPASGTRRWRISIARQTCAVTSSELAQASP